MLRLKNVKIEIKILLSFLFIALLTLAVVFGLTHYLYQKFYVDRQIEMLSSHGHALVTAYEQNEETFYDQLQWANESLDWDIIFTDDPMLLSGSLPFDMPLRENLISFEERQTLLAGSDLVLIREHDKFNQHILAVVIPIMEAEQLRGALFLYTPLSAVFEPFRPLQIILIISSLLLLGMIVFIGRKMANVIVKPLKNMTQAAGKIASGDLTERLHMTQKDELGELAESFNSMAASLQQIEQNRRDFLANVAHELRTPISYMKGFTEGVEEGLVKNEQYYAVMTKEIARLERLVNELLDLAQLEGDSYALNQTPISFAQLIMDVVERFEMKLEEKQMKLQLDLDESLIVYGDSDRLEQVVTNLLQNALTYSDAGKPIELRLEAEAGAPAASRVGAPVEASAKAPARAKAKAGVRAANRQAVLRMRDYGVGIPAEDVANIFERFYRVNKARTRSNGGLGIGLTIVQQIVKKHQGELALESQLGAGTIVTVKLPLMEEV